jgi:hypothetical protein
MQATSLSKSQKTLGQSTGRTLEREKQCLSEEFWLMECQSVSHTILVPRHFPDCPSSGHDRRTVDEVFGKKLNVKIKLQDCLVPVSFVADLPH